MRNLKIAIVMGIFVSALICCTDVYADSFSDLSKTLKNPIVLKDKSAPKMAVNFNHASHKNFKCGYCHHAKPEGSKSLYASCSANEACHAIEGKSKDIKSSFMAYHYKSSERSCFGCHRQLAGKYPNFKGCRPCHMPQGAQQ